MSDGVSIQHVNVMVDDLTVADAFYTEVLGLERAPTPDLGFPAQFYRVGDFQQIHVNQLVDVHPQRSHFCLRVDDFNGVFAGTGTRPHRHRNVGQGVPATEWCDAGLRA